MTVLTDRYELGPLLGSGGMARVYSAHDRRLDRQVAVKLVRDELLADAASHQRLLTEARAVARLHHPNAVAVYDVGEDDGRTYIVMELVEGRTLQERLRDEASLPVVEAVEIGARVLDALRAAHVRGLVHRDVKPSNILLPDEGGVKLADFGIAKVRDAASTGVTTTRGIVVGTPRYLAPEQAAGASASPAGDIYALGVVLYEALAGSAPFDGDTAMAVALAHRLDPIPPLRERAPQVPAHVAAAVERALAKDPADRFADAEAMRRALLDDTVPGGPGTSRAGSPPLPPPPGRDGGVDATRRLDVTGADAASQPTTRMGAPGERGGSSPSATTATAAGSQRAMSVRGAGNAAAAGAGRDRRRVLLAAIFAAVVGLALLFAWLGGDTGVPGDEADNGDQTPVEEDPVEDEEPAEEAPHEEEAPVDEEDPVDEAPAEDEEPDNGPPDDRGPDGEGPPGQDPDTDTGEDADEGAGGVGADEGAGGEGAGGEGDDGSITDLDDAVDRVAGA